MQSAAHDNAFAVFGLAPFLWIDPEELNSRYRELARAAHPDQQPNVADLDISDTSNTAASRINEAYELLRNDATRLALFVSLESGKDLTQDRQVPDALVTRFMEISGPLQQADQAILALAEASSPILKAQALLGAQPLVSQLMSLNAQITEELSKTRENLENLQAQWQRLAESSPPTDRETILNSCLEIYRQLSFLQRWQETLTEKCFQLTPTG